MSTSPRPYARTAAALLALAALFAYGPTPTASAEPASPQEEARAAKVEYRKDGPSLPGPAREDASGKGAAEHKGRATNNKPAPPSKKLMLTVPRLGLKDVKVGDSSEQSYLDREGIMHLSDTGFPYQQGSNTYIAAHAIGYAKSRVTYAFRDLENMKKGDRVFVRDAAGRRYEYRVYERMIVEPDDFWVTKPVEDKKIISLQTCWPEPSFEKRLVVRAQIVKK